MKFFMTSFVTSFVLFTVLLSMANGLKPEVPALFIFGDSNVDVGNNNHLRTIVKANFPPYGRDFVDRKPTGRFSNGKLALDYVADVIGFSKYQPAYLSTEAKGKKLLIGANFASAASGYHESTARLYNTLSLSKQLKNYKEYQNKLAKVAGKSNASSIISEGIYIICSGSSDFVQNYYINPLLFTVHTLNKFSDILIDSYADFVQDLYELGARRIGVTTLPPLGCLPAAITTFGFGSNECVERLNKNAISFNKKLNQTSHRLQTKLSGLNLVVLDIYTLLYELSTDTTHKDFVNARRACCGTGLLETSILCNQVLIGTCSNASQYVFWDGFHPSDKANEKIGLNVSHQGFSLIYGPN